MFFSIIICTYNPDERILRQVFNALCNITYNHNNFEIIIVDNNSHISIADLDCFQLIKDRCIVVSEKKAGLVYARIKGAEVASGNTIVFVDDDNIIDSNYLTHLASLQKNIPEVQVWGAGIINVKFIDETPKWVQRYMLSKFQERKLPQTMFGKEKSWPHYYPVGSGLIITKDVFLNYISLFKKGSLTAVGRKAESLASGEDSQIVWSAINQNISVGSSPLLVLDHVIPQKRTTLKYLISLNYNIAYSFYKGQFEIFGNRNLFQLKPSLATKIKLFVSCLKRCEFNFIDSLNVFKVENAWYDGYSKFFTENK